MASAPGLTPETPPGASAPGLTSGPRMGLLAGYVVATFLSFPHPLAGAVFDLGLVVSWLTPALLVLGLAGLDARRGAGWAFVAGWLAHSAVIHWIYVVTVSYGHAPPVVGVVAPLLLGLYMAGFTGVFGAIWGAAERRGAANPWLAALAWTALDHARAFVLTGFPWATLGYAQHQNPALMGLAPFTAVYGLSFTVALGGASLAALARARIEGASAPRSAWAGLACVALLHLLGALGALGAMEGEGAPPEPERRVRVAALQGNIDQGVKWSPEWRDRTVEIYEDLARRAAREGAEWIVFPESAIPGAAGADEALRAGLSGLARETGAVLVVGSVGFEAGFGPEDARYFDSAFLFTPDGELVDRYDKAHLVPFGEYVPFRNLLGRLIGSVARGMARLDVWPGDGPRALALPSAKGDGAVPVGVPICYELLFPDLVRRFVGDGAGVLLAITNDAWYGRTGAPYQFLAMTALRSAETGVWTVRAANTGVSAIIDGRGRVREQTPIFERDVVVADVPLRPAAAGTTFYVRYGDVFAWGAWLGLAAFGWRLRGRAADRSEA